jgi:putative redox protein
MVRVDVVYQGELRCAATHGPSGTVLITDAPLDNHGKAESFSPTDLVAAALGTCVLTLMGITARKLGVTIDGAKASVTKEMVAAPVRRIGALKVVVTVPAQGLSDEHKQKLEHAAHTCPVHQSLHPDIDAPIEFQWA